MICELGTRAVVFLLFLLVGSPLLAGDSEGGVIEGTVRVDEGGPFASVVIHVEDSDGGFESTTTTDAAGKYRFEGVPPGTYRITASCYLCSTIEASDRTLEPGAIHREDFSLSYRRFPWVSGLSPCPAVGAAYSNELRSRLEIQSILGLEDPRQSNRGTLVAWMTEFPSFGPVGVASVYVAEDTAMLVMARVVGAEGSVEGGTRAADLIEAPLDGEVARALRRLMWLALPTARLVPSDRIVLDGTLYEMSAMGPDRALWCGAANSPEPGTAPDALVRVGLALFAYAEASEAERPTIEDDLRDLIAQAEERFARKVE